MNASETPVNNHSTLRKIGNLPIVAYASTIFLSAFLLFQVQPLISKFILPWFGGSPAVWTAAMLFFQMVLFGGYLYAHVLTSLCNTKMQMWVHIGLLGIACVAVAITQTTPWAALRPTGGENESPLIQVLIVLGATVGLPYFVLSSTGPLLQKWFSDAFAGVSPYRLFALSNFGSLLALLSYPFFFEVYWGSVSQAKIWSIAFIVFGLGCAACAVITYRLVTRLAIESPNITTNSTEVSAADNSTEAAPSLGLRAAWVGLPALASVMFLAVTNEVCQNVATVPLLWIIPLSLYLLSFIVAFDHPRWYLVGATAALVILTVILVTGWHHFEPWLEDLLKLVGWRDAKVWMFQTAAYFAALFLICVLCHGQLAKLRPAPRFLTSYFMTMSLGGAIGGLFVNFVAKNLFVTFFEMPLGFLVSIVIAGWLLWNRLSSLGVHRYVAVAIPLILLGLGIHLLFIEDMLVQPSSTRKLVHQTRNFYGVLSVRRDSIGDADESYKFFSGSILHGMQLSSPERQREPLTYYGPLSGVGMAVLDLQKRREQCHIGVVGLGVGTLATYARPSDRVRYYEINPDVLAVAKNTEWFRFITNCRGKLDIVLGDARLQLEREFDLSGSQQFDLLCLDAFSGDAIPTHLLTDEAFAIYRKHLSPGGVLAVHITNTYLDLYPVVQQLAKQHHWRITRIYRNSDDLQYRNDYVLLSDDEEFIKRYPESMGDPALPSISPDKLPMWTDQYSNLLQILR